LLVLGHRLTPPRFLSAVSFPSTKAEVRLVTGRTAAIRRSCHIAAPILAIGTASGLRVVCHYDASLP
jgi:hypothetical protein